MKWVKVSRIEENGYGRRTIYIIEYWAPFYRFLQWLKRSKTKRF